MTESPGQAAAETAFVELTVDAFCEQLASGAPTPGGGAAAALMAKLSASLVRMVCSHTVGRPKYAAVEGRVREMRSEAEALGRKAGELMDADAEAFRRVSAAFKLGKDDPARIEALNTACKLATIVPLEVMRACASLAELGGEIFRSGNQTLSNDARAAVTAAEAAAQISAGNVLANLPFITEAGWAASAAAEADELLGRILAARPA